MTVSNQSNYVDYIKQQEQKYGLSDFISSEIRDMQLKAEKKEAHTRTIGHAITTVDKEDETLNSDIKNIFSLYDQEIPIRQATRTRID